jgi:hypothetical protein
VVAEWQPDLPVPPAPTGDLPEALAPDRRGRPW